MDRAITNDSSLAAVMLSDGSRYVFFQDISGSLRQAIFSPQEQAWTVGTGSILPNDAPTPRDHTPLSACITSNINLFNGPPEIPISLIYVSGNNSLAGVILANGIWIDATLDFNLSGYRTTPDSRALSFSATRNIYNASYFDVHYYLLYESLNGNVT